MPRAKTLGQMVAVFLVIIVAILVLTGPHEPPAAETGLEAIEQVLRQTQDSLK